MDQCHCGRPLWDGARTCESCVDTNQAEEKRYKERNKLTHEPLSGIERVGIRRRMSTLGRGYDQ